MTILPISYNVKSTSRKVSNSILISDFIRTVPEAGRRYASRNQKYRIYNGGTQ